MCATDVLVRRTATRTRCTSWERPRSVHATPPTEVRRRRLLPATSRSGWAPSTTDCADEAHDVWLWFRSAVIATQSDREVASGILLLHPVTLTVPQLSWPLRTVYATDSIHKKMTQKQFSFAGRGQLEDLKCRTAICRPGCTLEELTAQLVVRGFAAPPQEQEPHRRHPGRRASAFVPHCLTPNFLGGPQFRFSFSTL